MGGRPPPLPPAAPMLGLPGFRNSIGELDRTARDRVQMEQRPTSFGYDDLLACGAGGFLGPGNAQLPLPPMLMFDRISEIAEAGGEYGKGLVRAGLELKPGLWVFSSHCQRDT